MTTGLFYIQTLLLAVIFGIVITFFAGVF